ncbi:MAG: hypothetical protein NW205_00425 [Hyphomicrobiaceae bacterium]|nr:hypothetical protein [Hyphomicrobiaceae bacterium]
MTEFAIHEAEGIGDLEWQEFAWMNEGMRLETLRGFREATLDSMRQGCHQRLFGWRGDMARVGAPAHVGEANSGTGEILRLAEQDAAKALERVGRSEVRIGQQRRLQVFERGSVRGNCKDGLGECRNGTVRGRRVLAGVRVEAHQVLLRCAERPVLSDR